ncbi:glycosyltransferase family 4 protein [Gloeomargarita lithophora]|uniref:glycosyltransferase family 4 protein n=1 Tax=Gloeomargarita lithophora TaxID=1188228 RepID=UPI003F6ED3C0
MVKILHIQRAGTIAGSENHLLQLLPGLQKRGYDVSFLALTKPQEVPSALSQALGVQGIPVIDQRVRGEWQPQILPQIYDIIGRGQYDIIHTHLLYADLYGTLAARWVGKGKVLCTRHNDNRYRQRWPMRPLITWNTHWMHHVIAISEHIKAFNMRYQRVPEAKITVIPYGYEAATPVPILPRREADRFTIGMVGRLVPQKSHITALQALPMILKAVPQAWLVILGDGSLRQELTTLAEELDLTSCVEFVGYHANAAQEMQKFDLFLHPSLHEGFGLVLLEAMAAHLPIVATRVSAIPEIVVDGQTGLLIPPEQPELLAQAVIQLLTNADKRAQMGAAGYQRLLQEFTVTKMLDRTEVVYQSLVSNA